MADDEKWYMGFYIGHLHAAEQQRIRAGNLNPQEREMLARGEDPWEKWRGPLPPDLHPPTEEQGSEIAKEPTAIQILDSMRPETRAMFYKVTDPKEKAQMWQGAKKRWHEKRQREAIDSAAGATDRALQRLQQQANDQAVERAVDKAISRQSAKSVLRKKPQPPKFQSALWTELKQHKGWYLVFFLLSGLPVAIGTVWPALTHETMPEWLAKHGWPRLITLVIGWLAGIAIIALVIIVRSYLTVKRKRLERGEAD